MTETQKLALALGPQGYQLLSNGSIEHVGSSPQQGTIQTLVQQHTNFMVELLVLRAKRDLYMIWLPHAVLNGKSELKELKAQSQELDAEIGRLFDRQNQEIQQIIDGNPRNPDIVALRAMAETVRHERQLASTAFANFNQKANQYYNLLASVIKAMEEMRMGITRNML